MAERTIHSIYSRIDLVNGFFREGISSRSRELYSPHEYAMYGPEFYGGSS
jgi:hypothetical protein